MKKFILGIVSVFLCVVVLFGCTSEKTLNDTPLADVLTEVNAQFFDNGTNMKAIDSMDRLSLFYDIAPEDVAEFAGETAKDAATDINEVVLIKAVDAEAAKRVAEKLEIRRNSQKDLCASYSPELMAIVEKCSVRTQDTLVTLIICEDFDGVTALCDELMFS